MISVRGLTKTYQDGERTLSVLDQVDLEVAPGEWVAITGASGSGKSTLLQIVGGLDVAYRGEVEVAGARLGKLDDRGLSALRNRDVGFVFQSFHLVPELSAAQNVALPAFFSPGLSAEESRSRATAALERVGMGAKADRTPARLSGGERQRVAIARALLLRPKLLLCDEPTGNLDAATGEGILSLFRELHQDGLTLLAVTHEDRLSRVAGRVLALREGKLHGPDAPARPRGEVAP
jgi:putative ABC transport system ATP-binding protein